MSENTGQTPPAPAEAEAGKKELGEQELERVSGGIGMLLPAVQKVRDAAARSINTEGITIPHQKIVK